MIPDWVQPVVNFIDLLPLFYGLICYSIWLLFMCSFQAALNMLTKMQSMGYKEDGILCTAIHPGWVKTDLGTDQVDFFMIF